MSAHYPKSPGTTVTVAPLERSVLSAETVRDTAICILLATLWLATRPYFGVIHDARFYTLQAFNALLPGRFADDLYFRFGSQDQFTLFTPAYNPVLALLGLSKAALLLTIVGQCFWVSGLLYLAAAIFRDRVSTLVAVATAIVLPNGVIFAYGEPFLTPRLFAEALVMWSLGSMLRDRTMRALLLLCVSAAVHPIMTVPGFAAVFIHQCVGRRDIWLLGALAVLASVGLACFGVQPFARLSASFDPAWFLVVRVRDFFCLLTEWHGFEWVKAATGFALGALVLILAEPRERRFLVTVLVVALGGLAATLLGGDLLRNVLVVDAQQYRATWLLTVTANLFVGPLCLRLRKRDTVPLIQITFVSTAIILALTTFGSIVYLVAAPMTTLAAIIAVWERNRTKPAPSCVRMVVIVFVGLALGAAIAGVFVQLYVAKHTVRQYGPATLGLGLTVVALAMLAWLVLALRTGWLTGARPIAVCAIGLLTIAVATWDQRTPWTKFIEETGDPPPSLTTLLAEAGSIYWEGDVRFPWFVLKRPNYFSCPQGTGSLFFRETAMTYQHRYDSFAPLRISDFGQETSCPVPPKREAESFDREGLASVCTNEPGLGALVLTRPVPNVPAQVWRSPVTFEEMRWDAEMWEVNRTDQFFIYSCADFRRLARAAASP